MILSLNRRRKCQYVPVLIRVN